MSRIISIISMMVFLSASSVALTGCNTVEGVGKDIQNAGKAIEGAGKN